MKFRYTILILCLFALLAIIPGCARAARDTSGFAVENSFTIPASFEDSWQIVKTVLREQDLEIYTRDKRGTFVAYSKMRRNILLQPHRVKYTIELGPVSDAETSIYIETVRQLYGVTLLTYPDWHDRKTTDATKTIALMEAIQAEAGVPATPVVENASAS